MGAIKNKLIKYAEYDVLVTPVGFSKHNEFDLWLNCEFDFDTKRAEPVCTKWFLTDYKENRIELGKLTYEQVKFVSAAMSEEVEAHIEKFYYGLEAAAYGTADRLEETT